MVSQKKIKYRIFCIKRDMGVAQEERVESGGSGGGLWDFGQPD